MRACGKGTPWQARVLARAWVHGESLMNCEGVGSCGPGRGGRGPDGTGAAGQAARRLRRHKGDVQFVGKPTVERVWGWLEAAGAVDGAPFRAVQEAGRATRPAVVNEDHATGDYPVGGPCRCGRSGERPQHADGQRPELGHYRGLAGWRRGWLGAGSHRTCRALRARQPAKLGAVARPRHGTNWTLPDPPGY